jgi:preprotein translocase subunit SecA
MLKNVVKAVFGDPNERELAQHREIVEQINAFEPQMQAASDEDLRAKSDDFKERLSAGETLEDLLPEAYAVVREASVRTTGLRHFDEQMIGGIVLHQGKIAEMKTGEGKTLVATLPLYLNGLLGKGAHLITPNDYLSKYGLQQMGPVYTFLGLSAAVIQNAAVDPSRGSFLYDPDFNSDDERYQYLRPVPRREAYAADVTYGTNNEFGFDYLRDNMVPALDRLVQGNLHYAIVDEIDNILIDEARTPLIISGTADPPSDYYRKFVDVVKKLAPSSEQSIDDEEPDGDYVVDIKDRVVFLTERGIEKIERWLGVEQLYHPDHAEMIPYLDNVLRAFTLFKKDKDYVVQRGEIIIVDSFTGRLMHGRRFSEGLHQGIEAKEGVEVRKENLTMATITFQNYFRMYEKLSGMTGTAATEAEEFERIYDLEVTMVPTHKPIIRADYEDMVYMTERAKFKSVVEQIRELHENGQPVLVGTVAIETSERIAKLLKRAGIPHEVLNAKQHFREAPIIAQAGRPGAVTIATNMAGRGVDILLGGNPDGIAREKLRKQKIEITEATDEQWSAALQEAQAECQADREKVLAAGGLFVLGTERHEARRIDNQLRGRSGRQGDPGASRFFLSMEDDLMKRFGGDRVKGLMQRLDIPEDQPIEHGMISKTIQQAQVRVEGYNFDIRKHILEYDDVVNKQREVIYGQRRQVLMAENPRELIEQMIEAQIEALGEQHLNSEYPDEWDLEELYRDSLKLYPVPAHITADGWESLDREGIETQLREGARAAYTDKEAELGEHIKQAERMVLLDAIDTFWRRHLTDLDVLREGIGLMAVAQRDPLVEYKREAFGIWQHMQDEIQRRTIQNLFRIQVREQPPVSQVRNIRTSRGGSAATSAPEPVRATEKDKLSRNDPCWCGSGKKYKNCHYREDQKQRQTQRGGTVRSSRRRRRR